MDKFEIYDAGGLDGKRLLKNGKAINEFGMLKEVQKRDEEIKAMKKRFDKTIRAHELYINLLNRASRCAYSRAKGQHGIAVDDDYWATEWQKLEFRIHLVECYIKQQPINWFFAKWLSDDEVKRRNNEHTKPAT